jgi:hypothetical protein
MSGWRREGFRITASPDFNTLFPAGANLFATMANKVAPGSSRSRGRGPAPAVLGRHASAWPGRDGLQIRPLIIS